MRPEEYRSVIKRLETHYQEFLRTSQGSELFGEEEQNTIKGQFAFAQNHYDGLIVQLPTYSKYCKPLHDLANRTKRQGGTFSSKNVNMTHQTRLT